MIYKALYPLCKMKLQLIISAIIFKIHVAFKCYFCNIVLLSYTLRKHSFIFILTDIELVMKNYIKYQMIQLICLLIFKLKANLTC